jgi:two-component system nitrate/nitrite response regulator NarL
MGAYGLAEITVMTECPRLTPRERDLLRAILDGHTNKEIANRLGIEVQTVKNSLARLYQKCGVSSRLELAVYATRHRLRE